MNISQLIKTFVVMVGFGLFATFANAAPPTKGVTIINDETNPVPVTVTNGSTTSTGEYQLIGVTTDLVSADIGINGMNKACEITFGDGARMCSSEEAHRTSNLDDALADLPAGSGAWIRSTIVSTYIDPVNGLLTYVFDYGEAYTYTFLNCRQWTRTTDYGGGWLYKFPDGQVIFDVMSCASLQRVTCCAKR